MQLLLENVRSFCDMHSIPLKPLTLLVGENSTGKTTFLGMLAHVSGQAFSSVKPSFNVPPFDLGTFDSIATFKGGRYGRAGSFSVGFAQDKEPGSRVIATYVNYMGQPQLSKLIVSGQPGEISVELSPELQSAKVNIGVNGTQTREFEVSLKRMLVGELPVIYILRNLIFEKAHEEGRSELVSDAVVDLLGPTIRGITPVFALAPVRTKPERTYDEISDEFKPEGNHIPVLLARIWQEDDDGQRRRLFDALEEFGSISSLFRNVGVRRLGRKPSDPFQILITLAGPAANLPDVGYGVSQVLPVIVQSVLAPKDRRLLLQQPEVHLHPRSQAALGSFFARLVAKDKKEFVIETHSDYLIDRIRQETARGRIKPEDVLILFFEKEDLETAIHRIELDRNGNLVGAPPTYRQFFLDEEISLLSRAEM